MRELTCACETRVSGRAAPIQPKRKGSRGMNGLSTKRVIPQKPSKQFCHFRPAFCLNRTTRPRRLQPRRLRGYCTSKQCECPDTHEKRSRDFIPRLTKLKHSRPSGRECFSAAHTCVCLISRGICYSSSLPDGPQVLIGRAAKQENPCFGLLSVLHLSIRRRRPCYLYGGIFCTFQQTGRYQK